MKEADSRAALRLLLCRPGQHTLEIRIDTQLPDLLHDLAVFVGVGPNSG
jgi:hypothetical protein